MVEKPEASDVSAPKSRTDFNQILLESVNESIAFALQQNQSPELIRHLQKYIGQSADTMCDKVDLLFSSLTDSFGISGTNIRMMVARRMYKKAGIATFYDIAGTRMIQHVYALKRKLEILNPEK